MEENKLILESVQRLDLLLQQTTALKNEMALLARKLDANVSLENMMLIRLLPSWSLYFILSLLLFTMFQLRHLRGFFKEKGLAE